MATTGSPRFPAFAVASGEEGSDPLVPHADGIVRVDEFESSGHYGRMEADVADVAGLGVDVFRYGMPWRLTEPEDGRYDWSLWDRALAACDAAGVTPVIDLCHFGLPDHLGGFCDPAWVSAFDRYLTAFLDRYPDPRWFTVVNEPFTVAFASGMTAMWNDRRSSADDFLVALANCVLAQVEGARRILDDRDATIVGAEAFLCVVEADDVSDEVAAAAAATRSFVAAPWDLLFGHPLRGEAAVAANAVDPDVLARIARSVRHDRIVAGHDIYPTSVLAMGFDGGSLDEAARVAAYEAEARDWYERYGVDFWIAETSNLSLPVERQEVWLAELLGAVDDLLSDGLPVRGLCWYSRGDQVDWDSMLTTPVGRVTEVGLFDGDRRPRPVAAAFAELAAQHR